MSDNSILLHCFGYNSAKRTFFEEGLFGIGLGSASLGCLAHRLTQFVPRVIGESEENIARELGEALRFRLIFMLLPEECLYGAPHEDKPIIRTHLENLGVVPTEDVISAIKFFCENFRKRRTGLTRKIGIEDVFVKYRTTAFLFRTRS
jgi:hypothetical protein